MAIPLSLIYLFIYKWKRLDSISNHLTEIPWDINRYSVNHKVLEQIRYLKNASGVFYGQLLYKNNESKMKLNL